MIVEGWRFFGDPLRIKTSCDGMTWSSPINVDVSLVNTYHPGKIVVENGIWYGTLEELRVFGVPQPWPTVRARNVRRNANSAGQNRRRCSVMSVV
jgi:hypothetical protein